MSVRKELLERELSKLGFRKSAAQYGAASEPMLAGQHGDGDSSHPRAGSGDPAGHP